MRHGLELLIFMNKTSSIFSRFDRPLVLGHRGVPEEHQENTLSGFKKAVNLGIDGVELDVILSKDNKLVVFHDDSLDRLVGRSGSIPDMNWQELKRLEIKQSIDAGDRIIDYGNTERLCLLEDVLEETRDKLVVNIELKGKHPDTGKNVVGLVQEMNLESKVFVTSFYLQPLRSLKRSLRKTCPQIEAGFAFSEEDDWLEALKQRFNRSILGAKLVGARLSSKNIDMLNKDVIDQHHKYGCAIGGWTFFAQESKYFEGFDSEEEETRRIKFLQDCGVDFLITDQPLKLISILEKNT